MNGYKTVGIVGWRYYNELSKIHTHQSLGRGNRATLYAKQTAFAPDWLAHATQGEAGRRHDPPLLPTPHRPAPPQPDKCIFCTGGAIGTRSTPNKPPSLPIGSPYGRARQRGNGRSRSRQSHPLPGTAAQQLGCRIGEMFGNSKTYIVEPVTRVAATPERDAHVLQNVVECPPSQAPIYVTPTPQILHPFPHIPTHIMSAAFSHASRECANRRCSPHTRFFGIDYSIMPFIPPGIFTPIRMPRCPFPHPL